ncbi:phosphotransferase family protein [Actinacidiphila oryziradicis]|uniref:Phosphotransferase family protein n=1 Tax=Actinacidiphila oryziradicis TaxID=2571141 RepID=A0A4U0S6J5_9ACTN|nr:phosphotransferase family protein [Actinacidiphila oryziradicis]TKA04622.1 phosphotransferase family protein [Actinacidiphila oryziradicis]
MNTELPGLPAGNVEKWLHEALPDLLNGGPWQAEVISGGLSNITYRLHLSGGTVILRRPPLGEILPSAHDMKREHRILTALAPTNVPVPRTLALCTDPEVLGRPFYVMTEVPGDILRTAQDTANLTPEARSATADALMQTLADLHSIDPAGVGLADYGRPDGYCARQILRWGEQWQRSRTRGLPDMDVLLNRLSDSVPEHSDASIVHGDYRLDNTIIEPGVLPPRIAGVLDWELSTLGDPLADLGMTLTYWHDRDDTDRAQIPVAVGVTTHEGFPSSHEVAEKYATLTGRDLGQLPFYLAFSAMKLAVILEGVHARYLGGRTVSDGYAGAGEAVPFLVAKGLRQLRSLDW